MKTMPSHFMISVVKDMDKVIDFYKNVLGLKVLYKTDDWAELSFSDDLELALHKVDSNEKFSNAGIGFQVENCEEATNYYESKGAKIDTRCQTRGNVILTQFADPEGNVIWLAQRIK
jgi:predicted enzyme related to lactoylglutathione lyase